MSASEVAPPEAFELCPRCRLEWILHDLVEDDLFCLDGQQAPETENA